MFGQDAFDQKSAQESKKNTAINERGEAWKYTVNEDLINRVQICTRLCNGITSEI
jgi:hypothetical protein